MCTCDGGIFRADVFSSIACGFSVSTVKMPVPLANLYRLQPVATDSKKTRYSVSTVPDRDKPLSTALVVDIELTALTSPIVRAACRWVQTTATTAFPGSAKLVFYRLLSRNCHCN